MNKYDKLCTVGEGAYGVVLKCTTKETGEVVAIKKFKERDEDDEQNRKASLREVKILRALRHENIVEMKEAFRRRGTLYLVFEFVDRSVLDLLEARPSGLEAETVRLLMYQLARALDHCHRLNIIHRDIKPENLLVNSADNALRLCDFGCARKLDSKSPLTDYVATRWYRPPELLLSANDYGTSVDLWALGCIAGEIFDGRPLFPGESDVDQLFVIQRMMGALTAEQMKLRMESSSFASVQFPDAASPPQTLEKRYPASMPPGQMELMKSVLSMDPAKRATAKAVMKMPWFKDITLPASLSQRRAENSKEPPGSSAPSPSHKGGHKKAAEAAARMAFESELSLDLAATPAGAESGKENHGSAPPAGRPKLPLPLGLSSKAPEKVSGGLPSVGALTGAAMDMAALSFGPSSGKSTKQGWGEDSLNSMRGQDKKVARNGSLLFRKDSGDLSSGRPPRRLVDSPAEAVKQKKSKAAVGSNPYVLPWEATAGSDDIDELFAELGGDQPAFRATAAFGATGGFGAAGKASMGATGGLSALGAAGEGGAAAAPRRLGDPPPGAANAAAKLCLNGDRRTKRWTGA